MRHQSATAHELARVALLAGLPGETLARLGERMERREIAPGEKIVEQGDEGDRFYVLLSGLAVVVQSERGARRVLRPGSSFGEVSLLVGVARTATVQALTPATVASCDGATFEEFIRPLFTDA